MGVLQRLCKAAARALGASGAGVSVMAEDGARGVAVWIRAHTYAKNRRLNDVARDIVARRLRFDLDHS